jgi:hypothetical protein
VKTLSISGNLVLPLDAVTQAIGLVGQRGSGKTHALAVLAEELISAGAPVAILDPLGVLWGLRSSADGKKAGLPVVILGGERGDVPLESTAGKVIADWVASERRPCVLDVSTFRKAEQRRFVTDFALELYQRNREPLHLVVDEADLFIPQRPRPDEAAMLGAFEDLIRRGRARGLGITIATQRPAVVHKDALTQVGALLALRLVGPQDRDAVEAWIKYHGDKEGREKVLASLGSLPVGTAWFWSPGWMGVLKKIGIRARETFDSSATPKLGAAKVTPRELAPVELEALKGKIAQTIERAKADDPKALRARIAELEKAAKVGQRDAKPEKVTERVEVPVFDADRMLELKDRVITAIEELEGDVIRVKSKAGALLDRWFQEGAKKSARSFVVKSEKAQRPAPKVTNGSGEKMPTAERKILVALAQSGGRATKRKIAVFAGYAVSGGGFNNALSACRSKGWIEGSAELVLLEAGETALGSWEPLPTGRDALAHWIRTEGKCEAAILTALDEHGPELGKEKLAAVAGYVADGGGFNNALSRLRTLELIEGSATITLSEELR